jgi:predicted HTH domain antitoxin
VGCQSGVGSPVSGIVSPVANVRIQRSGLPLRSQLMGRRFPSGDTSKYSTKACSNVSCSASSQVAARSSRIGTRTTFAVDLPNEVFAALRRSPDEFSRELRLAAAIHWHQLGRISQEKAAAVAGLDRTDFLLALARERLDVFKVDLDELKRELELLRASGMYLSDDIVNRALGLVGE